MSTVEEVTVVLSLAAALDPRFNAASRDEAQARIVAWTDVLDVVPGSFALTFVRRYYRSVHDWPVTPAMIRQAWLREQRRAEQVEQQQLSLVSRAQAVATEDRSPEVVTALAEAREAIAQARTRWGVS